MHAVGHVHQRARFGDGLFVRVQRDFNVLRFVTKNLVVDFVGATRLTVIGLTAADGDRLGASLSVPVTGRLKPSDGEVVAYSSWDGALVRWTLRDQGRAAMRVGSGRVRLRLGDHPLAAELRSMGWSTTPLAVGVGADGVLTGDLTPQPIGPAGPPPPPAPPQPTEAPVVVAFEDGRQEIVDQRLDRLPFSAAAAFEQPSGQGGVR